MILSCVCPELVLLPRPCWLYVPLTHTTTDINRHRNKVLAHTLNLSPTARNRSTQVSERALKHGGKNFKGGQKRSDCLLSPRQLYNSPFASVGRCNRRRNSCVYIKQLHLFALNSNKTVDTPCKTYQIN